MTSPIGITPAHPTAAGSFARSAGDGRSEVALTLDGVVAQPLGWLDQLGLWGNLGVSLLGFTGAVFVLQPGGAGTPELSLRPRWWPWWPAPFSAL